MILGLALTNFVYLELKFPEIFYKKLLGEEANLEVIFGLKYPGVYVG